MERELLLAVKSAEWSSQKINAEVGLMKKIIPYLESFHAFVLNNEVLDLSRHKVITKKQSLFEAHKKGVEDKKLCFVICKN